MNWTTELLTTIRFLALVAEAAAGKANFGSSDPIMMLEIAEQASDRIEHLAQYELESCIPLEQRRRYMLDDLTWLSGLLGAPDDDPLREPPNYNLPALADVQHLHSVVEGQLSA